MDIRFENMFNIFSMSQQEAYATLDWERCALCQEENGEKLQDSMKSKHEDKLGAGYYTLEEHLTRLHNIGEELPLKVDLRAFR